MIIADYWSFCGHRFSHERGPGERWRHDTTTILLRISIRVSSITQKKHNCCSCRSKFCHIIQHHPHNTTNQKQRFSCLICFVFKHVPYIPIQDPPMWIPYMELLGTRCGGILASRDVSFVSHHNMRKSETWSEAPRSEKCALHLPQSSNNITGILEKGSCRGSLKGWEACLSMGSLSQHGDGKRDPRKSVSKKIAKWSTHVSHTTQQ